MTGSVPAVSGLTTPRDDVLETLRNQLAGARRELTELRALMARADAATTAEALKSGHVATESLTVDDLNRLAEKVRADQEIWKRPLNEFGGTHWGIEKSEARRRLAAAAPKLVDGLLAAAREVEGLRAEVERLRGYIATSDDDFDWSLVTTAEVAAASDDAVAAMRAERDAAVLRADTAERRLADIAEHGIRADLNPTVNGQSTGAEMYVWFCDYLRRIDANVRAAAGPVPVTPVTEDQK